MEAAVTALFDEATNTVSYIVSDPATAKPAIVDCVLDFNPKSARTSTCSADRLIEAVRRQDLEVEWILETHVHADHLSAAPVHQGEARAPYPHRRGGPRRAGNLQAHLQSRAGLCHDLPDRPRFVINATNLGWDRRIEAGLTNDGRRARQRCASGRVARWRHSTPQAPA